VVTVLVRIFMDHQTSFMLVRSQFSLYFSGREVMFCVGYLLSLLLCSTKVGLLLMPSLQLKRCLRRYQHNLTPPHDSLVRCQASLTDRASNHSLDFSYIVGYVAVR